MARLKQLEPVVEKTLREYPSTRNDDFTLYGLVALQLNEDVGYMAFPTVLSNHSKLGLPPFESVSRCRRKLQSMHEDLRASKTVEEMRAEEEQDYRAYAKEND